MANDALAVNKSIKNWVSCLKVFCCFDDFYRPKSQQYDQIEEIFHSHVQIHQNPVHFRTVFESRAELFLIDLRSFKTYSF